MSELTAHRQLRRKQIFFSWTGALLLAGIFLMLNFIASYLSLSLDTSEGKVYSISSGTKQILKELDDKLVFRVFFSSQLPPKFKLNEQYLRDLLTEYKRASHGKISIEFIDPGQNPKGKQDAIDSGVPPVNLDVIERDRREVKECFMGLAIFYGDRKESIALIQDTQGIEYEITQRVKKLVKPGEIRLGLITNGEAMTLKSEPLKQLEAPLNQLYSIQTVDLAQEIPAGLKALWLLGPSKELDAAAVAKLKDWVNGGGTLGLLLDNRNVNIQYFQTSPQKTGLDGLLKEWGIDFRDALVVDPRADRIQIRSTQGYFQMINLVDYPYFPLTVDLDTTHPATKGIDALVMPFVSPLIVDNKVAGLTYRPLAKSSSASWLDPAPWSVNPLQKKEKPKGATEGPFNLAMVIEGKFDSTRPEAKPGKVILFGTSRFIRTDYPPHQSNFTIFVNMLDWSAQDEILLSIRSKGVSLRPIKELPDSVRMFIKYLMIMGLPLLAILVGLVVWRRQKTRRQLLPLVYAEI